MMSYIDTSVIYHLIKSQSVIKLYIFYNMLEVCEKDFLLFNVEDEIVTSIFPRCYRLVTGYSLHLAKISSMLYFGRPLNLVTPEQASSVLFFTKFQQLLMSVSFFSLWNGSEPLSEEHLQAISNNNQNIPRKKIYIFSSDYKWRELFLRSFS